MSNVLIIKLQLISGTINHIHVLQLMCLVHQAFLRDVSLYWALVWLTVTESRLPHLWQPSQKAGDEGGAILEGSQVGDGGGEGPGGGVVSHPGDNHQGWGDHGGSKVEFEG